MYKEVYSLESQFNTNIQYKALRIERGRASDRFNQIILQENNTEHDSAVLAFKLLDSFLESCCSDKSSYSNERCRQFCGFFYVIPKIKSIYCFRDGLNKPMNPKQLLKKLQSILPACKPDSDELYTLTYMFLKEYAKLNPVASSFNRYLHTICHFGHDISKTIFRYPLCHFIKIDDNIFFTYNMKNPYALSSPEAVPILLNNNNFDFITETILGYPKMPMKLKRHYISALRRLSPMKEYMSYPTSDSVFFTSDSYVKLEDGRFVVRSLNNGNPPEGVKQLPHRKLIDGCIYNYIPQEPIIGDYVPSDRLNDLICNICGNKKHSLKTLAKLTASAYLNDIPFKNAVIFLAEGQAYENVKMFFLKLFNSNVYLLHDVNMKNYDDYIISNIFGCNAYILEDSAVPLNIANIRKLVKSTYFEIKDRLIGKIRFKNKVPFIFLTSSRESAKLFNSRIKSTIIVPDNDLPSMESISDADFVQLRQMLVLYGMKLMSSRTVIEDKADISFSDKKIIASFIDDYCTKTDTGFASKLELREAFAEYTKARYPYFKSPPIAICNRLVDLGYDGTHKKRMNGHPNPIAVFKGIEFNRKRFEEDMSLNKVHDNPKQKKSSFSDTMKELYDSKIDASIEPTAKNL